MNEVATTNQRAPSSLDKFRGQFEGRRAEIAGSLPAHIPYERFARVIMNAVAQNPDLLAADRGSLLTAAAKAATDGLLCDGREAALVIFNKKIGNEWAKSVQYMPMVAGILKKVRNSGELSAIVAKVVYAGDKFRNWIDDSGEHIEYEASDDQDREIVRRVFAMAKLKDGSIEVEVLTPADIEKIRNASRSKDKGPWVDWWDQMAIKSAIRRLSKRLPLNTDLDDLMRRDEALYDLAGASDKARQGQVPRVQQNMDRRLEALVSTPAHDTRTGEIIDNEENSDAAPQGEPSDDAGKKATGDSAGTSKGSGGPAQGTAAAPSGGGDSAEGEVANEPSARTKPEGAKENAPKASKGITKTAAKATEASKVAETSKAAPAAAIVPAGRKMGDDPDFDTATKSDLLAEAERRAAEGFEPLAEFEEGLDDYESTLIEAEIGKIRRAASRASAAAAAAAASNPEDAT
jgi:recombination protein RecT